MPDAIFDTPRRTEFWCNLPNIVKGRAEWSLQRSAGGIRQQRDIYKRFFGGLFNAGKVWNMAGDAWIMQPVGGNPVDLLTADDPGYVTSADVELAPHCREFLSWRKNTTLGADGDASLPDTAEPTFQRTRPAGVSLDVSQLADDFGALPPPTTGIFSPYPLDRILSGTVSYPQNAPFRLKFHTGPSEDGALLRFYFGGETEVLPFAQSGGHFCLTLGTNGAAELHEWDVENQAWTPEWEFAWDRNRERNSVASENLFIVPYGLDRLGFVNLGVGQFPAGKGTAGALEYLVGVGATAIEATQPRPIRLFRHNSGTDDHKHLSSMTGIGTIRCDRPRTNRMPFSIVQMRYPNESTLIDAPFFIDTDTLPTGTPMTITADTHRPPGTEIRAEIHDADTGVVCVMFEGNYITNANQRKYFVKFTFTSNEGDDETIHNQQTPVLYSYNIDVDPEFVPLELTPFKTARITSLNIFGCGLSPTEENANLTIKDEVDEIAILSTRDQMRGKVVILDKETGLPISVIFEGQTASPKGALRGFAGDVYPSPNWRDYQLSMVGLWGRLFRQFHLGIPFSFANSQTSPHPLLITPGGSEYQPWRVTDMVRWCLNRAGVPDEQLDIPDNSFRLPYSPDMPKDAYAIMAGTPYGKLVEDLVKDVLGQILVRDPNAGATDSSGLPTGMWRLLPNPDPASINYLTTISLDLPPIEGRFVMAEGAYGDNVWPILQGTWNDWAVAPEGNVVVVHGVRSRNTDDGDALITNTPLVNLSSFDPFSPNFLEGETVRIQRGVDPFLNTQGIVDWVARIIYYRSCFAEKWFRCTVPLMLLWDAFDTLQALPRPLRVNDKILIRRGGVDYPALIRSGNPAYEHDELPWINLEGKFL